MMEVIRLTPEMTAQDGLERVHPYSSETNDGYGWYKIGKDSTHRKSINETAYWYLHKPNDSTEVNSSKGGESSMVFQVVIEKITLATASAPERREIALGPITIEARDEREAMVRVAVENAAKIDLKSDYLQASIHSF